MANVQALDFVLEISQDSGTTWKFIVCEESSGFDFSRSTNTRRTKCDGGAPAVGLGGYEWSFSFSGAVKADPTSSQLSYKDLVKLAVDGTKVRARRQNPASGTPGTVMFLAGDVYVTAVSDSSQVDDVVSFDFTLSGDGPLDYTP